MTGLPSPADLAALTALSRSINAGGTPAMMSAHIMLDEKGYVWGGCPDDPKGEVGMYLHSGVRLGWAPLVSHGGVILSLWGGLAAEDGFEEEGVISFITRDGLRRLAADLLAIADAAEPMSDQGDSS